MKSYQKWITVGLAAVMSLAMFSCSQKSGAGSTASGDRPSTWIADRKVVIQAYIDDAGYTLPDDQANSPAFQELKRRTGIDLQINYTPGQSDQSVLAAQLAAGTIPDIIMSYLNDSTRPEFSILLKAARDGMFADLSPYFAGAKAYNRYLEDGYLPHDTKDNVMWRKEFGGKAYLVHLSIRAVDDYLEFDPTRSFLGGPYIQERVANALNVDVRKINTPDDFYNLLVRIKNGGFKDDNGRPVTPLGPKYWGGSWDALNMSVPGLNWGVSDSYNLSADGRILHEIETDWARQRVLYTRRLLAEGLMDPEFFTMDSTRVLEYYTNNSGAVIGDVHNYVDLIMKGGWIPLSFLYDYTGSYIKTTSGKTGYCAWAVNADAKNPEELFKFMDYLSTYEGQVLGQYGIEGLTFNYENGKPRLNNEVLSILNAGDNDTLINKYGFSFGSAGSYFFELITNIDNVGNFGEDRPGMSVSNQYTNAIAIGEKYNPGNYKLVEGFGATAYLSQDSMVNIKAKLDLLNYPETQQQAIFAASEAEAIRILDSFKQQFIAAGGKEFEAYLEQIYRDDPKSLNFR